MFQRLYVFHLHAQRNHSLSACHCSINSTKSFTTYIVDNTTLPQHTQTMRAATILIGLLRIGAYLLPSAASFQTHPPAPVRDGAIIGMKGASASNRDEADPDGRAAFAGLTRRSFAEDVVVKVSILVSSLLASQPTSPAHASGGATAGGAYLLSGTSVGRLGMSSCALLGNDECAKYSNLTLCQQSSVTISVFSPESSRFSPSTQGEIQDPEQIPQNVWPLPSLQQELILLCIPGIWEK